MSFSFAKWCIQFVLKPQFVCYKNVKKITLTNEYEENFQKSFNPLYEAVWISIISMHYVFYLNQMQNIMQH